MVLEKSYKSSLIVLIWLGFSVLVGGLSGEKWEGGFSEFIFVGDFCLDLMGWVTTVLSVVMGLSVLALGTSGFNKRGLSWFLLVSVSFCFLSDSFLSFYVYFELSLVPIVLMIILWGSGPERLDASYLLAGYTIMGSVPLLIQVIFIEVSEGETSFNLLDVGWSEVSAWGIWFFVFGLLVKFPVYFFHLWLPKAHVEASAEGSMYLAGLLLKMGSVGVLRVMGFEVLGGFLSSGLTQFSGFMLLGVLGVGVSCFRNNDLKVVIAYSSVAHMSVLFLGCLSGVGLGVGGILMVCFAHGVCSAGLFLLVGSIYSSLGTRNMGLVQGFLFLSAMGAFFWVCFCSSKASFPPFLNFIGEVLVLQSVVGFKGGMGWFVGLNVFIVGLFSLFLYLLVKHGNLSKFLSSGVGVKSGSVSLFFLVGSLFVVSWFMSVFSEF